MKSKDALLALSALAQETRLAIFRYLVEVGLEGSSVSKIGEFLSIPLPTLSFHLKELRHAKLLTKRQQGRFIWYVANFAAMNGLVRYLTENCCGNQPEQCATECIPTPPARKSRKP